MLMAEQEDNQLLGRCLLCFAVVHRRRWTHVDVPHILHAYCKDTTLERCNPGNSCLLRHNHVFDYNYAMQEPECDPVHIDGMLGYCTLFIWRPCGMYAKACGKSSSSSLCPFIQYRHDHICLICLNLPNSP